MPTKSAPRKPRPKPVRETSPVPTPAARFPIVGIGASAGGLTAFEAFFHACPVDTGLAFVLVSHLDPGHHSLLTEILQRATAMPVVAAVDQAVVAPDHVYVLPPNREMAILGGTLQLFLPDQVRGKRMPIDGFLRSLAEDQGAQAIGVVLSGTATDGTEGLRAILAHGGATLVQDPQTARFTGMPESAIRGGHATHVLSPDRMPAMLLRMARRSVHASQEPPIRSPRAQTGLNQILVQLRSATGHDFSLYKKSTIVRRILRRMAQHHLDDETVYARYLRETPGESELLFKELLINVTSFFRDPEAFTVLAEMVLAPLLASKPAGYPFRVWVAGCASGEEAYSIAIVLRELLDAAGPEHKIGVQIYATDLDDDAIVTARAGRYPEAILGDVTEARLSRFFTRDATGYEVKKQVRDMVVFAVHDVIKDPSFTKLDLLSCRNLLIYLEPELQDRLIERFHDAIRPEGVLFLSPSESIVGNPELFTAIDRRWKLYRVSQPRVALSIEPGLGVGPAREGGAAPSAVEAAGGSARVGSGGNVTALSIEALLRSYAPASVTTDLRGNILYVHGDTGRYLRPAPGPLSNSVVDMAREGLELGLRSAIDAAVATSEPTLSRDALMTSPEGLTPVRFSVRIFPGERGGEPLLLVSFEALGADEASGRRGGARAGTKGGLGKHKASAETARIAALERELAYTRESLKAANEEHQAANEELKSVNEELQSTNEELQSSIEELETSREELQSLNEETISANAELNAKIEQLTRVQDDMKNLLDSSSTGTLFLDHRLIIRRYTPAAVQVYRLISTDVGRPLGDITTNLEGVDLRADLQAVLDSLIPIEREVRSTDGAWYLARIQPYRTLSNMIEGVVLTFTAVTELKRVGEAATRAAADLAATRQAVTQLARELAEAIVDTLIEPLLVLDGALRVVTASRAFCARFQLTVEQTVGRTIYELGGGQWNIPALRELLEDLLPQNQVMEGFVVEHDVPGEGRRRMVLNARRLVTALGHADLILLVMVAIDVAGVNEKP